MAKVSGDFERFLKANFPDDFLKVTRTDVPEDVIETIVRRREDDYKIWCNVPEWIKNEYNDNLPDEVFNGNVSVQQFVVKEEDELKQKEKQAQELMDYSVSLLAAGYAAESVSLLVKNREERENIMRNAKTHPLDKKLLARIIELREQDSKIILKDWKENQSEKYFLHLARELSRAKKRERRASSPAMKAASEMKISSIEREFREMSERLNDDNFRQKLVSHLRSRPEQAFLGRMDGEVFGMLQDVLGKHGIKIEQHEVNSKQKGGLDKNSLMYELKKQYEERINRPYKPVVPKVDLVADRVMKRQRKRVVKEAQSVER
jgi:hypothetical protein